MLLAFLILGIILSILLVHYNARTSVSAMYLGGFFFTVTLYAFIQYVILYSKSVWLVSIVFINFGFLAYFIGPMLYWYVRSVLTDQARLKKSDLWHLLPALLFLIGALPYILTPLSFKTAIAAQIIADPVFLNSFNNYFLFHVIPTSAVYQSRPIMVLAYSLWSTILLIRYLRQQKVKTVLSTQHFMINWLSILLGSLILLTVTHILLIFQTFMIQNAALFYGVNLLQIISGIGMAGLLISPFFFPAILYGLPRFPETPVSAQITEQILCPPVAKKSKTPGFELDYLEIIQQMIDHCMENQRPYLQPGFNLVILSKLIKVPVHHLTYYFREIRKQTFIDYRNQWRIEHAKRLILDGKASELSLEGIGLSSGFSSRNTFFNSFKKFAGTSPSAFLNRKIK